MGSRRWFRRILKRKDAAASRAPTIERLEPRVLFGGGPAFLEAVNDIYPAIEDRPRLVEAPGILVNDQFAIQPQIMIVEGPSNGQLELREDGGFIYTPQADWSGQDRFTYQLIGDGLVSNVATVYIPVAAVNDPPAFSAGNDITVKQDAGLCLFSGWASWISAGPPDESSQSVRFLVEVDRPDLFEALPDVLDDGTLRFKPAGGATGTATITVWAKDDGGTANGGSDISQPASFKITIGQPASQQRRIQGWLPTIRQGDQKNKGISVGQLISELGIRQDENGVKPMGLAITGIDNTAGIWEYSADKGLTWQVLGTPAEGRGVFLPADNQTRVRFVPNLDFCGTLERGLVCRPWDGQLAGDFSTRYLDGLSNHLGSSVIEIGIVVNPVIKLGASKKGNTLTIYQQQDSIRAVYGNRTILNLPLGTFEQLIVIGAHATADKLVVDLGKGGAFSIPEGILFEAGTGKDTLVLLGSQAGDQFEVYSNVVLLQDLTVTWDELEQIQLQGLDGDDIYKISSIGVPTILKDTNGRDTLNFWFALSSLNIDLSKSRGQWQNALVGSAPIALFGTFEDVIGTSWSDIIKGNNADNRIWGWCGDDVIYGRGGNDWLFGHTGKDLLFGQSGNDLLFGGDGIDRLDGGSGNDILIGGAGKDLLLGSGGQNILIGGSTVFDDNTAALKAIMAQWSSKQSFATKVQTLTYGGGLNGSYVLILGRTVLADLDLDQAKKQNQDWLFPL